MESFFKHGNSLALYRVIGEHQAYWDSQYQSVALQQVFLSAQTGALGEFEQPFLKYLPREGPILEAGCGTGKYVWALRARGYKIEGIDYAAETIGRIRQVDATLDVRVGDIYAIDRPDNHYAAYISIGVLEHNFNGQDAGLAEAYRVLRPGGIGLITVPYLNCPRRRVWRTVSEAVAPELPGGLCFYQDHLDIQTFKLQLEKTGFQLLEQFPYLLFGGLIRDWRLGRWLYQRNFFSWRLSQFIKKLCQLSPEVIRRDLSHMMLFVVLKPR